METIISNFHLEDAEKWICQIQRYYVGHSEMYIKVFRTESVFQPEGENVFYFNFQGVTYFEGPTIWKGANFTVGSEKECLQTLKFTGTTMKNEDKISQDYILFKCEILDSQMSGAQIKIIAAPSAFVTREKLWI